MRHLPHEMDRWEPSSTIQSSSQESDSKKRIGRALSNLCLNGVVLGIKHSRSMSETSLSTSRSKENLEYTEIWPKANFALTRLQKWVKTHRPNGQGLKQTSYLDFPTDPKYVRTSPGTSRIVQNHFTTPPPDLLAHLLPL